jgi:hypothetical protein
MALSGAVPGGGVGRAPAAKAVARSRLTAGIKQNSTSTQACAVYVAKLPLVGLEALDALPALAAAPAALHEMVVLRTAGGDTWAYDFVPENPTDPGTIARLLAGRAVRGVARTRQLRAVPARRCRLLGDAAHDDALAVARSFQEAWGGELQLFRRDCRVHVAELARALLLGGTRRC